MDSVHTASSATSQLCGIQTIELAACRTRRQPAKVPPAAAGGRRSCDRTSRHPFPTGGHWHRNRPGASPRTPCRAHRAASSRRQSGSGIPNRLLTNGSPGSPWCEVQAIFVQHRQAIDAAHWVGAIARRARRSRRPLPSSRRRSPEVGENGSAKSRSARLSAAAMRSLRGKCAAASTQFTAERRAVNTHAARSMAKSGSEAGFRSRASDRHEREKNILRHGDAGETTLNRGFKWERLEAFGLPATRRTCTPGFRCAPMVVIKGQGECFARRRPQQRTRKV